MSTQASRGSARMERSAFRQVVTVETEVGGPPATVWALLTDAGSFSTWNSTVESIEGSIAPGERLEIRVPSAPGRAFHPRVVEFDAPRRMVWRDGALPMFRGTRTFVLEPVGENSTRFTMSEEFRGVLLPMIRGTLPDFVPVFDAYAADVRAACAGSS